jgi:hypothetical protein
MIILPAPFSKRFPVNPHTLIGGKSRAFGLRLRDRIFASEEFV